MHHAKGLVDYLNAFPTFCIAQSHLLNSVVTQLA